MGMLVWGLAAKHDGGLASYDRHFLKMPKAQLRPWKARQSDS